VPNLVLLSQSAQLVS